MTPLVVALEPAAEDGLIAAVESGGGRVGDVVEARALVWTNPRDPDGLRDILGRNDQIEWVQLPFAGIEKFVAAGVVDEGHTWTCTKGVYGPACAEHALALMLAASRALQHHARAKSWRERDLGAPERRMAGARLLVVGTGGIGRALVCLVEPLEVHVTGVNRSGRLVEGFDRVVAAADLDEVLGEADYVVVAAALTPETRGMFSAARFAAMDPSAWLVNVARGGLVDTDDLVAALRQGEIAGAALDVTDPEPLPDGHPLWDMDNVLITPHVANTWDMALPELRAIVKRNVAHFLAGEDLEGLVDPSLGY